LTADKLVRLNRAIAACGLCSRRAADQLIASGKVKVNGKPAADFHLLVNLEKDHLSVSGKVIAVRSYDYILLHKPIGIVSTCQDEHGRKNILGLLPVKLRHLKPAGRLDYDSSGLIFLTNDGALINKLTHPTHEVEKTYRVAVSGKVSQNALEQLASGISLKEAKTRPAKVCLIKNTPHQSLIEIAIKEGKNRQIRRMCAQLGLPVLRLVRTAIGKLQLEGLPSGEWRHLTKSELTGLRKALNLNDQ